MREVLHNTLHTLHTLINNISQCVLRDISKYHFSNVSKTHWEFQCVLWKIWFKYIIVSKTHLHSQCVLETFMYLEFVFLRTHWNSQCVLGDISNWCNYYPTFNSELPWIVTCAIKVKWMPIDLEQVTSLLEKKASSQALLAILASLFR